MPMRTSQKVPNRISKEAFSGGVAAGAFAELSFDEATSGVNGGAASSGGTVAAVLAGSGSCAGRRSAGGAVNLGSGLGAMAGVKFGVNAGGAHAGCGGSETGLGIGSGSATFAIMGGAGAGVGAVAEFFSQTIWDSSPSTRRVSSSMRLRAMMAQAMSPMARTKGTPISKAIRSSINIPFPYRVRVACQGLDIHWP